MNLTELMRKRRYAGIILTYKCSAACRHCCFACSPKKPHAFMSKDDAVEYLREFWKLDRVIHIAGGEPFIFYERLLEIVQEANRLGVPPHFVETNASWCVSDELTEKRFRELKNAGLLGMYISADIYHQEFVSPDRVRRGIRIAREIFGAENVAAASADSDFEALADISKDEEKFRERVSAGPPVLVGSAARTLAHYLDERPIQELDLQRPWGTYNPSWGFNWEIHVDQYGNVQTNCGVVLFNAKKVPLASSFLNEKFREDNPIAKVLCEEGVGGLLKLAEERGYQRKNGYCQKCYLCFELRSFLRPYFPEFLAPDEIYTF